MAWVEYNSFRPLSGYLISKYIDEKQDGKEVEIVSVPSRGILFPNGQTL